MAADLKTLIINLQNTTSIEKRPDRAIRDYVRSVANSSFSGKLKFDSLKKTIAYAKRPELRNGNTATVSVPETDIILQIQLLENQEAKEDHLTSLTFSVIKYDGYSKTVFAQQEAWQQVEERSLVPPQETPGATSKESSGSEASSTKDPLSKFQEEALQLLQPQDNNIVSDTSKEEQLLTQMQTEAAVALANMTDEMEEQIKSANDHLPNELVTDHIDKTTPEHVASEIREPVRETRSIEITESILPSVGEDDKPGREIKTNEVQLNPTRREPIEAKLVSRGEAVPIQTADTADPQSDATLDDLMLMALGHGEKPITQDLLAAIVSLQTGIPITTVVKIQHAMWLTLSSPETFGKGKATYNFPLLGTFTVRKHESDFNLDFASSDISLIQQAEVNEQVDFNQAKEHVASRSGPQIARHAFGLALSTAATLGVGQAHTYQTIYRSVLLLLRIFGKGERRVRIEEIGEFYPGIIAGTAAYRFRAYPTFIRATSAAFNDAIAFAAKPGEAQLNFENKQSQRPNKNVPQQETKAAIGCMVFAAIIFFSWLLSAISG